MNLLTNLKAAASEDLNALFDKNGWSMVVVPEYFDVHGDETDGCMKLNVKPWDDDGSAYMPSDWKCLFEDIKDAGDGSKGIHTTYLKTNYGFLYLHIELDMSEMCYELQEAVWYPASAESRMKADLAGEYKSEIEDMAADFFGGLRNVLAGARKMGLEMSETDLVSELQMQLQEAASKDGKAAFA